MADPLADPLAGPLADPIQRRSNDSGIGVDPECSISAAIQESKRQIKVYEENLSNLRKPKVNLIL